MKRAVNRIGTIGMLMILLFPALVFAAPQQKGPRIEVKQERYLMGNVVQGVVAVHVFEVRNTGNEQLVIESVKPS